MSFRLFPRKWKRFKWKLIFGRWKPMRISYFVSARVPFLFFFMLRKKSTLRTLTPTYFPESWSINTVLPESLQNETFWTLFWHLYTKLIRQPRHHGTSIAGMGGNLPTEILSLDDGGPLWGNINRRSSNKGLLFAPLEALVFPPQGNIHRTETKICSDRKTLHGAYCVVQGH